MSHSWTDTWLEISFTVKHFTFLCKLVLSMNTARKKNCPSNEFFISSNLTLLLVCGLEANEIIS